MMNIALVWMCYICVCDLNVNDESLVVTYQRPPFSFYTFVSRKTLKQSIFMIYVSACDAPFHFIFKGL